MRGSVCGFLLLFASQIQAAPKALYEDRLDMLNDISLASISNPFGFGENEVRQLKNYLKSIKEVEGDLESMTREQALLYLFAFYDYDKSSHLDGLELLKLLCDFWSQQPQNQLSCELVAQLVDEVLEKQDPNWDGLLNPSELLAPPVDLPISKKADKIQEEEVKGPPHEPQNEIPMIQEGLQGHEESQIAGGALLNHQGSHIPENLENNANVPVQEAVEFIPEDDYQGIQVNLLGEEM